MTNASPDTIAITDHEAAQDAKAEARHKAEAKATEQGREIAGS